MDNIAIQQRINGLPLLKYRYLRSFPSNYGPILPNELFAINITLPNKMQGHLWRMIATSRHKLLSAHSLGRE